MAEQFSMPSMFDTRYAMDRQMQTDAHAAGIAGGGGKRYGMYYNSSLLGDRDNASLMSLTGMMGGQGDPRIQKQNAIDTIMQQYPNPETAEDFKAIANALQQQGLYDESNRAMSMANEIKSSMPKSTYKIEKIGKMKDGKRYTQFWQVDNNGNFIKMVNEQLTSEPSSSTASIPSPKEDAYELFLKSDKYIDATDKAAAIQEWESGYARDLLKPTAKDTPLTGLEGSLALFRKTAAYTEAKTPEAQIALEHKHITDYSKLNDAENYSEAITRLMSQVNGQTMQGGVLYDAASPNGRNFTRLEAEERFAENKRETVKQKERVSLNESAIKHRDEFSQKISEDASKASVEIRGLESILTAYENGGRTGRLESMMIAAQGILADFGFSMDIDKLANSEILVAEFASIALKRMGDLSGSASDNDIIFVKEGAASLNKTKEANMLLVDMALFYAHEKEYKDQFLNEYINSYDGVPKASEIRLAMNAFKNRGDDSARALKKYGKFWGSDEARLAAVEGYGTNQYDRKGQLEKLKIENLTTETYTYENNLISNLEALGIE